MGGAGSAEITRRLLVMPRGIDVLKVYKDGVALLSCTHDLGYRRLPGGGEQRMCRICKGDDQTTKGYTLPVKLFGFAPAPKAPQPEAAQTTLF